MGPFDREVINQGERPLGSDVNQISSRTDRALRDMVRRIYLKKTLIPGNHSVFPAGNTTPVDLNPVSLSPITGFIGDSLQAMPTSPTGGSVMVPAGIGFVYAPADVLSNIPSTTPGFPVVGVDDLSDWKPLILNTAQTFAVPTAPTLPNTRIDIIEVAYNRHYADSTSREVFNPNTDTFSTGLVNKTLAWDLDSSVGAVNAPANSTAALSYKTGVPGNPGAVPPTTPGYVRIAQINVGTNQTVFDWDSIIDWRKPLFPLGSVVLSGMVTYPHTGSSVLLSLNAPPGFRAALFQNGGVPNLVIAGFDLTNCVPVGTVSLMNDTTTGGPATSSYTAPLQATAFPDVGSSFYQTFLNPLGFKLAIGQPIAVMQFIPPFGTFSSNLISNLAFILTLAAG